jgi:uncharacterized protein (TIGR00725 family)
MGPSAGGKAIEDTAFELGELVAREGWILLTGGRAAGVMDAASRGAKSVRGSITIGILPDDCRTPDVSSSVDIAIFTNMGDARNAINVQSSDVVIACGAGTPGTLSEVALALKAEKHVVLLQAGAEARRFLSGCGAGNVHMASDALEAIRRVKQLGIPSRPSWGTA